MLCVVLALAPMVLLSQIAGHNRFDVSDDQLFGYFGWRIAHGAVVYRDVWDNKPPGIYWINALGFLISGDRYAGVVALCGLAVCATLGGFYIAARALFDRGTAALGTILAGFFFTHLYFQGGSNRTETFLMPLELAAVAAYLHGWLRSRAAYFYLAGVLAGCAALCKQVGLAGWGSMGLHVMLCVALRDIPWKTGLARCLLLLLGLVTTIGAAAGYLAYQGALSDALFAVVTVNRAYFDVGGSSLFDAHANSLLLRQHMFPILTLPGLLVLVGWIWAAADVLRGREKSAAPARVPHALFFCSLWYVVALWGATASPDAFRHYVLPTLPPMMLLAAGTLQRLKRDTGLLRRVAQRAWVTAAIVAMGYFMLAALHLQWQEAGLVWWHRAPRRVAGHWVLQSAPWEVVGREVARLSQPEDRLQCWGYFPGVYLHARRLNATRFVTTEKIEHFPGHEYAERMRRELYQRLRGDPPEMFLIRDGDYAQFGAPGYDADWLNRWLVGWLDGNYVRVKHMPKFGVYLYRRRDTTNDTAREGVSGQSRDRKGAVARGRRMIENATPLRSKRGSATAS